MPKTEVAHGSPEKDFFIGMITKDIPLDACILDLLDNSIDGATKRQSAQARRSNMAYKDFSASINLSDSRFVISDTCGGIEVDTAIEYAFHFGRSRQAPPTRHAIGTYGIGMKRAIFKMGKKIKVISQTRQEGFVVEIDVAKWSEQEGWDFPLVRTVGSKTPGTRIEITSLNPGVGQEFADSVFRNRLVKATSRSYAMFLEKGFAVNVNGESVKPFQFSLKWGEQFKPIHDSYKDDGIDVELWAGLGGVPPDDDSPEAKVRDVERYGWYVICNDRVVIVGDKTSRTIWGDESFPGWHPQYNGFLGILSFDADDAAKLPWTTTKKEVDVTSAVYRRAVQRMKDATEPYLKYSHQRKSSLEQAKVWEEETPLRRIAEVPKRDSMALPRFGPKTHADMVNILYKKSKAAVRRAAKALGNPSLAASSVGSKTFDYFLENEVGD